MAHEDRPLIPKTIHYCWFGGGPLEVRLQDCIRSWQRVMPDYSIKEWNESNSPMDSAYVVTARKNRLWSKISNFVRLYAVFKEGGIYLDVDVEILKPFDDLLSNSCFLGFQQAEEHTDWVNNAVFGAVARHDFLSRCMNATLARFMESGTYYRSPEVTTLLLRELGLAEYGMQRVADIQLYPHEYFYPYPWWETEKAGRISEQTYCIHHWQLSWLDAQGRPHDVVSPSPPLDRRKSRISSPDAERIGSLELQIVDVRSFDASGQELSEIPQGQPFRIDLEYERCAGVAWAIFAVTLKSADGTLVLDAFSEPQDLSVGSDKRGIASVSVENLDLPQGECALTVGAYERDWAYAYDWQRRACAVSADTFDSGHPAGTPVYSWRCEPIKRGFGPGQR